MKPVEGAKKVNKFLEKAMPLIPVLGVTTGVLLSWVFVNLRPFVPWLFAAMTLSGALNLRVREIGRTAVSPLPILLFFFSSRIIMPVMVLFLSRLIFRNNPDVVLGFVFLYSFPTAVTGFIWVSIFKGDIALVLALILLDTILAPVFVPLTMQLLLGAEVVLDTMNMVIPLLFMVVLPTLLGVTLNEASRGKIPSLIGPWLSPLAKLFIFFVIAANSAALAPKIRLDNYFIWLIIAACICFNVLGFLCGKFMGFAGKLNDDKQTALLIAAGLKNTNAAMTLGVELFPAYTFTALPAVFGIMTQHTLVALAGRIFTKKDAKKDKKCP